MEGLSIGSIVGAGRLSMQVGDIVKHFLTEQLGIVLDIKPLGSIHVMWTTQGESLFGPGSKEWCDERSLDLLTSS